MKSADLEYSIQGLFTTFYPVTKAGEQAWREMAEATDGTGKVLTVYVSKTLGQLRRAGYTARKMPKQKPVTMREMNALLGMIEKGQK